MESGGPSTLNLKKQKSNEGEDIISNLPETIISHIVSCLKTRDAVRTSVLSKTWMCRWLCVTKLELNDIEFSFRQRVEGKQHFVDLVNRTLLLINVESFHLVLTSNDYESSIVNTWISGILNRDVKKLNIVSCSDLDFSAVSSRLLFNAYHLEELVLDIHQCTIRVPKSHVCFGHLKFLDLASVTFTLDFPSDSKDVCLDFPVLKELKIGKCKWLCMKSVTLKVPLLERFVMAEWIDSQWEESHNCAINICTLHLTEFAFHGDISQDIFLVDPSSVKGVVVNIYLFRMYGEANVEEVMVRACNLLKQFSLAKCLKLEDTGLLAESKYLTAIPQFEMLSHMELDYFRCEVLLVLLHNSPFLKTLDMKGLANFDEEILNSVALPNCLRSTLEVVKFGWVYGRAHELCLAKFLVKNASVLKKINISQAGWGVKPNEFAEFKEKLTSFKPGLNSAIIEFYPCS